MSLTLALANGLSGITASQIGLSTISQNVSNANTVGYSRQVVSLEQQVIDGVGVGVNISSVNRMVDDFLVREVQGQRSVLGAATAAETFFQEIQSRFGSPAGNTTISADLATFASALDTLSTNPEDAALRFDVVAAGTTLARNISEFANAIQRIRAEADKEIKTSVDAINLQINFVDKLNGDIAAGVIANENTSDLRDQRDRAISVIADNISISTFEDNDGRISILTKGGLSLLDTDLHKIEYTPAATVNSGTTFGAMTIVPIDRTSGATIGIASTLVTSGTSSTLTNNVTSGRLKGLLDIRDGSLPDVEAQIDALATAIRDNYNAVHNTGSAFPALNTLTGQRTVAVGDAFQGTGIVRIAVVDVNGTIVGAPLDLDLGTLGATTVGALATTISTALGANGTAAVVDGKLQISAANSNNAIVIGENTSQVTGTTQAFSHYFGLNDLFTGIGSTDFAVRSDIVADPSLVAMGLLSTTAVTGETGITIGDNRVVQKLAEVTETKFTFAAVGGMPAGSFTLGDFASSLTGLSAVRADDAKKTADLEQNRFDNLNHRAVSFSGVNVDEEMANMILFQNAFAASAQVMTTASEMFDTLLQIAG
jgi:flagellar hook-associated protein 1 FlgK